jgi:hypothetical protein
VVAGRELAGEAAVEDDRQHDRPAQDVGPVEARQRVEGAPERGVGDPELEQRVVPDLADQEGDAKDQGDRGRPQERPAVTAADRPDGSCIVTELRTRIAVSVPAIGTCSMEWRLNPSNGCSFTSGGQCGAVSRTLKYAAKSPAKNMTSEAMNRIIPRIGLLMPRRAWP